MTDERIKELAKRWCLFPTDNAWDEVMGFAYDLLAERREWVGLSEKQFEHFCAYCKPEDLEEIENTLKENNA